MARLIVDRKKLLTFYVISSFYLSLITPFIRGYLGIHNHLLVDQCFVVISQGYIYILPIVFILFVNLVSYEFFLILTLYFYLLIFVPLGQFYNLKGFIFGFKNYFIVLLYIPLIKELVRYRIFRVLFEKSINILFVVSFGIFLFEFISLDFVNPGYIFLRKLASKNYPIVGKPNGIDLGIHLQGYIYSIAFFYYIVNKRYFLASIAVIILFLSTVKTWIIGFTATLVFELFVNGSLKKNLIILFCGGTILFCLTLLRPDLFHHYIYSFSSSSKGSSVMLSQVINSSELLVNSIMPNGLRYNLNLGDLPQYIYGSEIFALSLVFQIGIVGFIIFAIILFKGLFDKNNRYRALSFLTIFAFLHTYSLNRAYAFVTFIFLSSYGRYISKEEDV